MNLEKAIRIKENYLELHSHELYKEIIEADRLGIEALKREQLLRHEIPYDRDGLLPGETQELPRLPKMIIAGPRLGRKGDPK